MDNSGIKEVQQRSTNIVHLAMRRPISVLMVVIALVLTSFLALIQMPKDILPNLGIPIIYVAQPYGGMDPAQMESYMTYYYEYHFLYISGIEHIESKNIQSTALIKLQFHPRTDMAQALAETINYVNRAKAFMPEGVVPPFVMRFDAGSEPVGNLVFSGEKYTLAQLQNFALNYVRPLFATLPGVSAPPPFGASQRTVVIRVDPKKLNEYNLSPYDVAEAISQANRVVPSGNIPVGSFYPIVPLNSVVKDIQELENVPLRTGTYPTVFLRDVGHAEDGSDIQTGYALVNGKRTVYIPVTKRADASTLAVVDHVQRNLSKFQSVLPEGVKVSYEFDQSGYVRRSIRSLVVEGLLGAILTSLMVFLFLRDWRSSLIVVITIPLALMGAIVALWLSKQTINMMTLGGLTLAIGILVDETTVTIENIHAHLSQGKPLARAALDGTNEILKPAFLTLLCILAVFIPSFFMTGVSRALFVPLSLAVGFSIVSSFFLSRTLVPVLSTWFLSHQNLIESHTKYSKFASFQKSYRNGLNCLLCRRKLIVALYFFLTLGVVVFVLGFQIGREIFPQVDVGQFRIRFRAPTGTKIEKTEAIALRVLDLIKEVVGPHQVESSVGFVGAQPPTYPINTIYLWTSGSQEAVLDIALTRGNSISIDDLKENLRKHFSEKIPDTQFSFEASGLVDRMMSQGSPTPIEIATSGRDFNVVREFARKVKVELEKIPSLRDLHYGQVFEYPAISVHVDRAKAGIHGLTIATIGKALVPSTSSSRFILQNYWSDPKNGINYQVQVEVPQSEIHSYEDVRNIPVAIGGGALPLRKFADVSEDFQMGEYDRYNMQRMVTLTANLAKEDLGHAAQKISKILKKLEGSLPKGVNLHARGQISAMDEMLNGLSIGLLLAIVVIFILLSANFESLALSLIVLSSFPAVLSGSSLFLWFTGTSLNIESFMGMIMAIGVAVANAILLVTFAERNRMDQSSQSKGDAQNSVLKGAQSRLRPILMTSLAMIVGMLPMALGLGEGGSQTAPLGRAVMGGLMGGTLSTLFILPLIYNVVQQKRSIESPSLDPDDPESKFFKSVQA